jgi:dihydroflavonol-4-reductase
MRIVITGGTGFIGSRLALAAKERGHAVTVLGLTNTPAEKENREELVKAGIEAAPTPVDALAREPERLQGADALIHLAAAQHEMNVPDAHFRSVNVDGTAGLLKAAAAMGVGRFVYGSTIGVYGARDGLITEATPAEPDNIYGRTKLEAERLVLDRGDSQPVTVVRISETYGPGDRRLLKLFKAIKRGRFLLIGSGRNLHHPIYVDDLVSMLLLAATEEAALGEVFLAAGKQVVTTDEMIALIAEAVGRPAPKLRLPLWPLMTAATLMEAGLQPLGIQPPLHRRRMDFFRKSFELDGGKARRMLHFTPMVDFKEGAWRTMRWYEQHGGL